MITHPIQPVLTLRVIALAFISRSYTYTPPPMARTTALLRAHRAVLDRAGLAGVDVEAWRMDERDEAKSGVRAEGKRGSIKEMFKGTGSKWKETIGKSIRLPTKASGEPVSDDFAVCLQLHFCTHTRRRFLDAASTRRGLRDGLFEDQSVSAPHWQAARRLACAVWRTGIKQDI